MLLRLLVPLLILCLMPFPALAQRSTPLQVLQPSGAASDQFGYAVAIDGDTMIVGAPRDDLGANANQGSAHIYRWTGSGWTLEATLTATGGAANDNFGSSVALSGDTALVGANTDDLGANFAQGSAYVFTRSGSTWTQQAQLTATDGAGGDQFGSSVALSGDTALVGARFDDVGANFDQGSAYIFTRSGTTWTQQAQLTATDGAANDLFGFSVALGGGAGDTALVGAHSDDVGANFDQGSAYVFTRSGTTWTQQAQLTATDGAASDNLGVSVALSGDTALVGAYADDVGVNVAQGSAYIFTRSGTTWTQQAQLTATGGAAGDSFGVSVALSGDTALVAAYFDDVGVNFAQGSAYIFTRSGTTWTQQAQLTATDGAASDNLGVSVALSGDTALLGANFDNVGANTDQGSAWVFSRIGTKWIGPDLQLLASNGAANDNFGISVALSGDTALVGAYVDDVGANANQGSAYVFTRSGSTWTQQAQLTAIDGAASDNFGVSVALGDGAGDTALVGAYLDNVGTNANQGSAWTFPLAADDFAGARNEVTGAEFPTLAAALLPATSGQQITATEAAWRGVASLNTFGRSLGLFSSGDLRTPSTSMLDLGGSSALAAASDSSMEVFGQLRSAGFIDLTASSFRLGSRGIMTARTGSSLTINAPVASLDGQTRLEQGASMTFAGRVTAIGPTTANLNSALTAGGTFANVDTFTITAGTISTPLFLNRAQANIFGSSAIFGSFTNDAGAVTTVRSGTIFIFGSLTNNGTIIGTICANCLGTPPNLTVGGSLVLGPAATLNMPFNDSRVQIGGNFDCAINSSTRFDLSLVTLQLEGAGTEQTLEVMSRDIGPDAAGLDRSLAGHYPIRTLRIGPTPSTVRLVDAHDNDGLGQGSCEAIYVDTLRIDAGSRLINTSCKIYYRTLINNGTVDVPANLIPLPGPCLADIVAIGGLPPGDGLLTGDDFNAFIAAFAAGDALADIVSIGGLPPGDGLLTGDDFNAFIAAFAAGCP
ncbi:MAG: FG-GAP repeat protein [bacterium]